MMEAEIRMILLQAKEQDAYDCWQATKKLEEGLGTGSPSQPQMQSSQPTTSTSDFKHLKLWDYTSLLLKSPSLLGQP